MEGQAYLLPQGSGALRGGRGKFTSDVEFQAGGLGIGSCRAFLKVEELASGMLGKWIEKPQPQRGKV